MENQLVSKSGMERMKKTSEKRMFCMRPTGSGKTPIVQDDLDTVKTYYKKMQDGVDPTSSEMDIVRKRFLQSNEDGLQEQLNEFIRTKGLDRDNLTPENIETFAVYAYQSSAQPNKFIHKIFYDLDLNVALPDRALHSKEFMDQLYNQGVLIQNYLKRNSVKGDLTVYRFEPRALPDRYDTVGETVQEKGFLSTTKVNDREALQTGQIEDPVEYPREYHIKLKSYSDISNVNPALQHQQEVLIPMGTRFEVTGRRIEKQRIRTDPFDETGESAEEFNIQIIELQEVPRGVKRKLSGASSSE